MATTVSEGHMRRTITYEWKLRGLKALFEGSKGDAKSKVTKSAKFDGGRWQILFYANSGTSVEPNTYCSLYLSCEPTVEEQESALNGKWIREGTYTFNFELGSCDTKGDKKVVCTSKDAHNLAFSHEKGNWGWASFGRRDAVYYNLPAIVSADAFAITCTITGPPHRPPPPRTLMLATGALLDDPDYSDVQFVLPRGRTVRAMKKMLARRASYFESMFSSGFSETHTGVEGTGIQSVLAEELEDDSDYEDDDELAESPAADAAAAEHKSEPTSPRRDKEDTAVDETLDDVDDLSLSDDAKVDRDATLPPQTVASVQTKPQVPVDDIPGRPRARVVVRDAGYSTYRALLYYLYTDMVIFAPLSSSFKSSSASPASPSPSSLTSGPALVSGPILPSSVEPASRREWIAAWCRQHPERARDAGPCSAKSMYRLADKLNLAELKARASAHIIASLSVHNIVDEVFGTFAATFAEVRKVEMEFFLSHWTQIRSSAAMRGIWPAIRQGRHPGFEQVWPMIVMNLEFAPGKDEGAAAGEVMSVST